MNIERIRQIDRSFGVLVCWFLSVFCVLSSALGFRRIKGEPKKILFLKPAEMGGMVVLYPTLKKAREMFPKAEFYFVTFKENLGILKILNILSEENILLLRTDSFLHLFYDTIKNILMLRRKGIDTVLDFEFFSRFSAIFSYLTGARRIVGFHRLYSEGLYRGNFMSHKVGYNNKLHAGLCFACILIALTKAPGKIIIQEKMSIKDLIIPKMKITNQEKQAMIERLKKENPAINEKSKLIILGCESSVWLPERKWPSQYNLELIKKMLRLPNAYVVVIGTGTAKQEVKFFKEHIKDKNLIDFVEKTSFRELIILLGIAKLLVAVDSGPTHFACLTDISIISIFGPETKNFFGPLSKKAVCLECGLACHPCFSVYNARKCNCDEKGKACLRAISVDSVFSEVKKQLK